MFWFGLAILGLVGGALANPVCNSCFHELGVSSGNDVGVYSLCGCGALLFATTKIPTTIGR